MCHQYWLAHKQWEMGSKRNVAVLGWHCILCSINLTSTTENWWWYMNDAVHETGVYNHFKISWATLVGQLTASAFKDSYDVHPHIHALIPLYPTAWASNCGCRLEHRGVSGLKKWRTSMNDRANSLVTRTSRLGKECEIKFRGRQIKSLLKQNRAKSSWVIVQIYHMTSRPGRGAPVSFCLGFA